MKNRIFKFAVVFVFLISSLVFPLETAFADDTDTQITVSFYLDRNSAKWYAWVGSPGAVLGSLREDLEAYLAELTNADGKRFHNWTTADGAAFSLSNEINESIDLYANYDHVWSSTTGKCIYCNSSPLGGDSSCFIEVTTNKKVHDRIEPCHLFVRLNTCKIVSEYENYTPENIS